MLLASRLVTLVLFLSGFFAAAQEKAREAARNASMPPAAWQTDPALGEKWKLITGRYIYQQACTECHGWGPSHWTRNRWSDYFSHFPQNHEPDVRDRYKDLTAVFAAGKMVPNLKEERDALMSFVLTTAPESKPPDTERDKKFHGLPDVGEKAPHFSITDTTGRRHVLAEFQKPLVLVFSRAHW